MNFDEYQGEARRTAGPLTGVERLKRAAMGLGGEAGEFLNAVKKMVYHDHPVNATKLALELGDALWYLSDGADSIGISLDEIARMNVEKLRKRYPDGFSPAASMDRSKEIDPETPPIPTGAL